ncbi:signal peptidase II [Bacteriovoracaceae bacterium]|mgnify:CR=1 FL=1|nr:signal peptidase II [Bacteriovoracaceae bacterium]|tara:strand:- start:27842 stop:28372 length:531 start_codon:yes stop_codon:yes gene_type:complete
MQNKSLLKFKIITLLSCLIVFLGLDQYSKIWAIESVKGQPTAYYLNGLVQILYAENRGAWGNLGSEWPELLRMGFLIVLPLVFLIGIGIYVVINSKVKKYEATYLSLIVAGGIGNLIDRIRYDYVVDFMYIGYGRIGTNIFNVADVIIMAGFFGILGLNILEWKKTKVDVKTLDSD